MADVRVKKSNGTWQSLTGPQGQIGQTGGIGPQGNTGPAGPGVPVGGTVGQVLQKIDVQDYATGWVTPSGGSDPWTRVILASDFSTTLATNTAVTGMTFAPAANKRYLVEVYLLLRTATATVGPRPGFSWRRNRKSRS